MKAHFLFVFVTLWYFTIYTICLIILLITFHWKGIKGLVIALGEVTEWAKNQIYENY
jgi:hypothetical protein